MGRELVERGVDCVGRGGVRRSVVCCTCSPTSCPTVSLFIPSPHSSPSIPSPHSSPFIPSPHSSPFIPSPHSSPFIPSPHSSPFFSQVHIPLYPSILLQPYPVSPHLISPLHPLPQSTVPTHPLCLCAADLRGCSYPIAAVSWDSNYAF